MDTDNQEPLNQPEGTNEESEKTMESEKYEAAAGRRKFRKADWIRFSFAVILLAGIVLATIHYMPFFISLKDPDIRMQWINQLRNSGFKGFLIAVGVQVAQVVVAVIPGEAVEIAMGYLYGTWGGLGLCLLGIFIGTLMILLLVKLLGASFVREIISEKKMGKLKFLHNARKLDTVVFILFLIPGTPKDMLTYFIPLTPMKPVRFLIISTFARIPSVVTSTLIGASLGSNRWTLSIIVFVLTGIMGIIGIQINNWYTKKHEDLQNV